ncbi:serine/arginine repetitive matrix protein 5-like [Gadus chalcogrammus]|uniref:serine/arginine repetitive matrix protein 5-like n=1 Tax=Gadus chalcogrammus TaxID=1042646 RepID=UPI0024C4D365|nr:serine/arginine repetitive matrix protein 5-like [Gadus chalcogrammus]
MQQNHSPHVGTQPNGDAAVQSTTGLQNASEVSSLLPPVAPSVSDYLPDPPPVSARSKKASSGQPAKKSHSKHRHHRSPDKKSKRKGGKSTGKDDKGKSTSKDGRHHHHHHSNNPSSGQPRTGRHRSPDRTGRSRSAENTLDPRRTAAPAKGRSPERRRHRSPHRSPYRSPHRTAHRSPHRSRQHSPRRSPYRSPRQSPRRRHAHSSDPYQRRSSPDRYAAQGNHKPNGGAPALREPRRSLDLPSTLPDSVLREPPSREGTPGRFYKEDGPLPRASSLEGSYRPAASLLREAPLRGPFGDLSLPRVRTPDSDSAYKRYSSLLRSDSPERVGRSSSRDPYPEPRNRGRSPGRDASPVSSFRRDGRAEPDEDSYDDDDDDDLVADKVREYYSTLKSDPRRSSGSATLKSEATRSSANTTLKSEPARPSAVASLPEPKKKTYKDSPKDLSI